MARQTPEELLSLERKAQAIWATRFGAPYKEVARNPDGTLPLSEEAKAAAEAKKAAELAKVTDATKVAEVKEAAPATPVVKQPNAKA